MNPVTTALSPETMACAAATSAAVAAEHADSVDKEGRIPQHALDSLRAEQLLGLLVPQRFGGPELSLRQVANVCRALAESCASTGLIFAMHQSQAAVAIRHALDSEWHQHLLGRMAREQSLIASATTEGATGGAIRHSVCFLDERDDGLHLEKHGSVISYALAADIFLISARRAPDAAASDQALVATLREQTTLTGSKLWNPIGMRGACTERYDLYAHCAKEQVFPDLFANAMSQTLLPTSHILLGSVWLGIAASAIARARAFLRSRNRAGVPLNPVSNLRLAEGEALVQQMRAMIAANLALYEGQHPSATATDRMVSYNTLKIGASELVVRATDIALRICGIKGYMEEGEFYLSRHIRDAHSATVMINDDRILGSLSSVVLGMPITRDV
ncbi:MAG: acyl-CoA dehydrogenase family protein [Giesbergeria sp.]